MTDLQPITSPRVVLARFPDAVEDFFWFTHLLVIGRGNRSIVQQTCGLFHDTDIPTDDCRVASRWTILRPT